MGLAIIGKQLLLKHFVLYMTSAFSAGSGPAVLFSTSSRLAYHNTQLTSIHVLVIGNVSVSYGGSALDILRTDFRVCHQLYTLIRSCTHVLHLRGPQG